MSPVLALCALAFADPVDAGAASIPSATPTFPAAFSTGAPPATVEIAAPAVDPTAAATEAPAARGARRPFRGHGTATPAASAAPVATAPVAGAVAPAATATPAPSATAAPLYGPVAPPAPAASTATPAPTAEVPVAPPAPETALPTPVAPSLGDVVVTAPVPAASPAATVLDTMPTPAPVLETMPATTGSMPSSGWAWPALLSGAGLVAAWQLRKRALAAAPSTLKVVQRHSLGEKSSLLVVDVEDGQGVARRLLVGSGSGGLNLIQDLGLVSDAPVAEPLPLSAGLPLDAPVSGFDASPRAEGFASLLDEVLEERAVPAAPVSAPDSRPARYFNPEDLAPVVEEAAPAARAHRRRAQLRGRFSAPNADWAPHVEAYLPPPADVQDHAEPAPEPVVEPVRRGAAALLARAPTLAPPARKSGVSALVKGHRPAPVEAAPAPAPTLSVVPAPAAVALPAPADVALPAPADVTVPAPMDVAPAPAPSRAVYVSPTMSQPVSNPDRRIVGPPLRDPRLTTAPTGPRLRLADARKAPAVEEAIPPVSELVERLLAQQAEAPRLAVNGNTTPAAAPRNEALKHRFQAIVARETGR